MQTFNKIKRLLDLRAMQWHYDAVQSEIDDLHDEIDTLSVRLSELIKLKCKIEIELHKQEQ